MTENAPTKLLLMVSDLWLRHMNEARAGMAPGEPLAELTRELVMLESLFNEVRTDLQRREEVDAANNVLLTEIMSYLQEHDPDAFPAKVAFIGEPPRVQVYVRTASPISQATADYMDEHWPGMIVLNFAPVAGLAATECAKPTQE